MAVDHVDDFILWAWGVRAGLVSKTKYTINPNDNNLHHFHIERHQAYISIPRETWAAAARVMPPPPAVGNLAVLGLLNTTISCQADKEEEQNKLLSKQLEHMIKQDRPKQNRIKNFHKSTLKMILFASGMDSETVSVKPVDLCKRFMNCKLVALAEQELNNQFESRGMGKVSFSPGYMANTYLGTSFGPVTTLQATTLLFHSWNLNQFELRSRKIVTSPSS